MTTDPQIVRALGDLEGSVRSMREQWKSQDDKATAGRREVYDKLDQVARKLDGVLQDVAEMKNEIDTKVMPTIDAYKTEIAKRVGAMAAGKVFWILITALVSSAGFAIHEILTYIAGGKHG